MESGSSNADVIKESKHNSTRGGASPRALKPFSVLNVCVDWLKYHVGGEKQNVPPFGASGLVYSKCVKSFGYLSSPKAESHAAEHPSSHPPVPDAE